MLLFLSIAAPSLALIVTPLLNLLPVGERAAASRQQARWVYAGYAIVLALSILLAITGVVQNSWESEGTLMDHRSESISFVVLMGALIVSLLVMSMAHFSPKTATVASSHGNYAQVLAESKRESEEGEEKEIGDKKQEENLEEPLSPPQGIPGTRLSVREASVSEALQTVDFWLLWIAQFFGTGSGLMTLNNLGQISTALGGSGSLYIACIICGLAYGCFWCLSPIVTAELFGTKAFGTLYSWLGLAPAFGSTAFSVGLAASIYSIHENDGDNCCLGQACYRTTYIICAVCTGLLASTSALLIAYRNKSFYSHT